jgi:low temperature requirement protein LtrA
VVIGIAADALGIVPYTVLTKIITLNDTLASWIGILLFISVYGVTKQQLGLFWADVMEEKDRGSPMAGTIGAWLVTVASVFGLVGGIITGLPATTIGWICALAIIIGSLLL